MNTCHIYNYIDELINGFLDNKEPRQAVSSDRKVTIHDVAYKVNIWSEDHQDTRVQVFEIRKEGRFSDTVYTKGVLITDNIYTVLSDEEMWNYGF